MLAGLQWILRASAITCSLAVSSRLAANLAKRTLRIVSGGHLQFGSRRPVPELPSVHLLEP